MNLDEELTKLKSEYREMLRYKSMMFGERLRGPQPHRDEVIDSLIMIQNEIKELQGYYYHPSVFELHEHGVAEAHWKDSSLEASVDDDIPDNNPDIQ